MKNIAIASFLIVLGTFKAFGDLTGNRILSGLGAATNASPAMKVFTAHQGFETHSSKFFLDLAWYDGSEQSVELSPAVYRNIRGPYNRRNVYGAALAYGPILVSQDHTRPLFTSVSQYAFCQPGTMLAELGLDREQPLLAVRVRLQARNDKQATEFPTTLEIRCE